MDGFPTAAHGSTSTACPPAGALPAVERHHRAVGVRRPEDQALGTVTTTDSRHLSNCSDD